MNNRLLGLVAVVLGAIGMVLQYGQILLDSFLDLNEIPGWLVVGTMGQTHLVSSLVIDAVIATLSIGLPVGVGYAIGRRYAIETQLRSFLKTVAQGSSLGVVLTVVAVQWSAFSTAGNIHPMIQEPQATEMVLMDVVILALLLLKPLAEVALVVIFGMLAGALLPRFWDSEGAPVESPDTDTPADPV